MKFFKDRKALTLAELIISITISAIVLTILTALISNTINSLTSTDSQTRSVNQILDFKSEFNRIVNSEYMQIKVFTWTTDVLFLKNLDSSEWVLLWVVDKETKLLDQTYTYWDKFLAYRILSDIEISEIELDSSKIYEKEFQTDKLYLWLRLKDFDINLYNNEKIIDIYLSVITYKNESLYWTSLNQAFISKDNLLEYNLVF